MKKVPFYLNQQNSIYRKKFMDTKIINCREKKKSISKSNNKNK